MKKIIIAIVVIGAAVMIAAALNGCTSSKNVSKEKTAVDSSYIQELESNIRVLQSENDHLQKTIHEMEYAGVVFDNDCDSVLKAALLKAGCNVDSINAVLSLYKSKVTSYANGMLEVEGRLKSFNRTRTKDQELIHDLQKSNDSLAAVKNKVEVKYEKATETKEKVVKRGLGGLFWTIFVLIIIAAFILGFWLCWKYKDDIQEQLDSEDA